MKSAPRVNYENTFFVLRLKLSEMTEFFSLESICLCNLSLMTFIHMNHQYICTHTHTHVHVLDNIKSHPTFLMFWESVSLIYVTIQKKREQIPFHAAFKRIKWVSYTKVKREKEIYTVKEKAMMHITDGERSVSLWFHFKYLFDPSFVATKNI